MEAETDLDEISTIAGSLGAVLMLIEEDVAGINDRPVKVRGNAEERQKDYKLRSVMTALNATLRDQRS